MVFIYGITPESSSEFIMVEILYMFLVSFWLAFTKHEFSPIQKKNKGELTSLLVRCFYFLGKIK